MRSDVLLRNLARVVLAAAAVFPAFARPSEPPQDDPAAYEASVKAVFLYNFTRYLQWPETGSPGAFTIVVFGESGIISPLREIAGKKTVGEAPIEVRQCSEIAQIGRPRILFIARSAAPRIAPVLDAVRGAAVLTVGEDEGLGARGVAINFVVREGAVKFEMNEKSLKEAGILASSQLLKLAIRIEDRVARGGQ